jgi:hypothetical protein
MRRLGLVLALLLWAAPAWAATYTVKKADPRDHSTIQGCVNVAQAGDTCEVYAGTYAESVISVRAGASHSSRITILAHAGDTVAVTSFYISHSWITVSGFTVNTGASSAIGIDVIGNTGTIIEHNTVTAERNTCIRGGATGPGTDHYTFRYNTVSRCGWALPTAGAAPCIETYGDDWLMDGNDMSACSDDPFKIGGARGVVRNNIAHDFDVDQSGSRSDTHYDFVHNGMLGATYILVEGNTYKNVTDPDGDGHFACLQGYHGTSSAVDYILARYNITDDVEVSAGAIVGLGSYSPHYNVFYNNTHGNSATGAHTIGSAAVNARVKNSLFYNVSTGLHAPIYDTGATGFVSNGNLPYATGYSGEWANAIASEATYATLKNQNPLFVNYPTSAAIQSGSPARDAGVALTTVAVADSGSGTSLMLADVSYFQPGWGPSYAGVAPDQLRLGASTYATIASINYATNTITLAAGVSRSDGDPVYLYKKSDGVTVLAGTLPDVGAYEYGAGASPPSAPTGVRIR